MTRAIFRKSPLAFNVRYWLTRRARQAVGFDIQMDDAELAKVTCGGSPFFLVQHAAGPKQGSFQGARCVTLAPVQADRPSQGFAQVGQNDQVAAGASGPVPGPARHDLHRAELVSTITRAASSADVSSMPRRLRGNRGESVRHRGPIDRFKQARRNWRWPRPRRQADGLVHPAAAHGLEGKFHPPA